MEIFILFIFLFEEKCVRKILKIEGTLKMERHHSGHSCFHSYLNSYFISNYFPTLIRFGVSIY
jgi:hypothetical protein